MQKGCIKTQNLVYCPNSAGCQMSCSNIIPKEEVNKLLERKTSLLFCNHTTSAEGQPHLCLSISAFYQKWVGEETGFVLLSFTQFSRTMPMFSYTSFQKPENNCGDHLQIFLAWEPTLRTTTSSINHKVSACQMEPIITITSFCLEKHLQYKNMKVWEKRKQFLCRGNT